VYPEWTFSNEAQNPKDDNTIFVDAQNAGREIRTLTRVTAQGILSLAPTLLLAALQRTIAH